MFPISLGCMGMSPGVYGASDEAESIATIHAALEAGVNLIDTGDFYGQGHNELLLARALKGKRDKVILSVKFGALRGPDASWGGFDARPASMKNFLGYSLVRLGVETIDVYRPSRLDPAVPIEDTIGAMADMVKAGYIRAIGLSEVGADTIRRAAAVHPITDLQIEYALVSRKPEEKIFPVLRELGIAATAYGVLSRGLLSGSTPAPAGDYRAHLPRFAGDNGKKNKTVVETLARLAADKGVKPTQLAIAWALAKGDFVVPVVGARTRAQLADALGAIEVKLSASEISEIEAAIPPDAIAGTRYHEQQMKALDSEK